MDMKPIDSHILHVNMSNSMPYIDYGSGIYLYDTTGKRYIDACSGPVACNIGHGHNDIAEAIASQAARVAYVYRSQFANEPIETFASLIADMAPGNLNRVVFATSGSDAMELALKLARCYHVAKGDEKRYIPISRWISYHGITGEALSVSGHVMRRNNYIPNLLHYPKIPPCYCYRCPFSMEYPSCDIKCARILEQTIKMAGAEYITAFVAEPIVGAAAGAITPPPEYFQIIEDICRRYGILLILDEVMTGFGRTGVNFAAEHWDITSDIIVFAKGASAGYWPTAGAILSQEIHDTLKNHSGEFFPGHTYNNTPMMGIVGCKVLEFLAKNNIVDHVQKTESFFKQSLETLASHPIVGDVRGRGFFWGMEFVKDSETKKPFDCNEYSYISKLVCRVAFERGLLVYPGGGTVDGYKGDHILIAPPLITQKHEIEEIVRLLDTTLTDVESRLTI